MPPPTAARQTVQTDWRAHFATWATHIGTGLSYLGASLARLGTWLAHLISRLARLSAVRPTPLQTLAILGSLALVSVLGAVAFPGNAIGNACVVAFIPGLCIAIGILGTRWYSTQALNQQLAQAIQNAVHATLHLKRSVSYVDDRLAAAQGHMDSGNQDGALLEVVRAKTATELSLGSAEQAARQWESLSGAAEHVSASTEVTHPRSEPREGTADCIAGSVARVEDQYTLIINRGSEHGTMPGMVFAVMTEGGDKILDPETAQVIGELPMEKLRVKVVDVQPKYSRATTFRTFTPARIGHPALTGFGLTSGSEIPAQADIGALEAIDDSITRMLETALAEPISIREAIANARPSQQPGAPVRPQVRVDIGDRVRQLPN